MRARYLVVIGVAVAAVVAALAWWVMRPGDYATSIESFAPTPEPTTILVTTRIGFGDAVTSATAEESDGTVKVTVRIRGAGTAGTGSAIKVTIPVGLRQPLGDRQVTDADGTEIARSA